MRSPALGVVLALALAGALEAAAQSEPALRVHAYTLRHQPAAEALPLVHPLLSRRGSVQLQPGGNTLVVRDEAVVVERVVELLREFDHPAQRLAIRIQVVRAGDGDEGEPLERELAERLRELLRYDSYRVMAATDLEAREGERVSYELGEEYRIAFQLGTLMSGERLKLHDFEVSRHAAAEEPRRLLHTQVNLRLGRSMILGLAKDESSRRALLLALTCTLAGGRSP
ncbi:MAG: secretin N-terminal domain-containing protein [Thermoanaerobaculia bacterium]